MMTLELVTYRASSNRQFASLAAQQTTVGAAAYKRLLAEVSIATDLVEEGHIQEGCQVGGHGQQVPVRLHVRVRLRACDLRAKVSHMLRLS